MKLTKTYFFLFVFITLSTSVFSQMKIGDNASTIDNASLLELESTTKALVITRVTTEQMLQITPLHGALIYNIDAQCVFLYNGSTWQNLCDGASNSISFSDNGDGSFTLRSTDGTTFTSPTSLELQGERGLPGNDGVGISTTTNNNDGTITFTYTDDSTFTTSNLKGADGNDGTSAFEIAVAAGFTGTQSEWLTSLQGADGNDGTNGTDGNSAFEIAVTEGFTGTQSDWLTSLKGADGNNGASAYEVAVAEGFTGNESQWLASLQGANGNDGADGTDGASAFDAAVAAGFTGTQSEWLTSLQGADGADGATAIVQNLDSPTTDTTLSTSALASYLQVEILSQSSVFSTSDLLGSNAVELSLVAHTFNPVISNISGARYVGEIQWEILETLGIFKNRFAIYVNGTRVTPILNIWPNVINLTSAPTSRFFEYTSNGNDVIELRIARAVGAIGVSQVLNTQLKLKRAL